MQAALTSSGLSALWQELRRRSTRWLARPPRQLRLCETLALGDRRFLALVECGAKRFLIAGTGASVALLATLAPEEENAAPETGVDGPREKSGERLPV
jgi:flagellar biogenesis protein FliO